MSHKVVFNSSYGGFSLSIEALRLLGELDVPQEFMYSHSQIPRHDSRLVKVVEQLGALRSHGRWDKERQRVAIPRSLECIHDPYLDMSGFPNDNRLKALNKLLDSYPSSLRIQRLKSDRYFIKEYEGSERVVEPHTINWIVVSTDH